MLRLFFLIVEEARSMKVLVLDLISISMRHSAIYGSSGKIFDSVSC